MRIRFKIIIPFTVLLILTLVLISLLAVSLLSGTLEAQVDVRLSRSAEILRTAGFALNPSILQRLKLITDAEICTFDEKGRVLASTIDPSGPDTLLTRIRSENAFQQILKGYPGLLIKNVVNGGTPYRVAYRAISESDRTFVVLALDTSEIQGVLSEIQRRIGLVALLIVILVVIVSQVIARTITSPLERLVRATDTLAAGGMGATADVNTTDEVGHLARAFNQMSQELAESENRLIRSEKLALTGQLSARVAHDIRNPLSSLKMQAQLLKSKLEGRAAENQAEQILEEIERVETIVKDLLDMASPGQLKKARENVNSLIREALRTNEARLRHLGIDIAVDLSEEVPDMMLDGNRLTRGLSNLIVNAMEAMPEGGQLALESRVEGGDVLVLVSDTGIGLSGIDPERIFDPFFTTKREGVGLGLVNAKTVVELHGGTIRLQPRERGGTSALIHLPISASEIKP